MAADMLEIDSDIEEVACKSAFDLELEKQLAPENYASAGLVEENAGGWQRESVAYPPLPGPSTTCSGASAAQLRQQAEKDAAAALGKNDLQTAVDAYTLAMATGGATAMMLTNRGALLLKQRRPCAAIRDCTAALKINSSMFKAYRVRGIAHQKLGHLTKAYADISKAQSLKFDEETDQILNALKSQCRKAGVKVAGSPANAASKPAVAVTVDLDDRPAPAPAPPPRIAPAPLVAVSRSEEVFSDLSKGQLVILYGLQNAYHLNGKRGVVERSDPRPASKGRWEIEVRLDGGKLEIKSLKRENIKTLNKADRAAWKAWAAAEKRHKEDRQSRQDREDKSKVTRSLEAKMSKLMLGAATRKLILGLDPHDAQRVIDKADGMQVANINEFVAAEVKALLACSDSDEEEPEPKRTRTA